MTGDDERLRPLHDQLAVRVEVDPELTRGGLYIPDVARRGESAVGVVVAVGPGRRDPDTGERCEMEVEVGDRIAYEGFRAIHKAEREVEGRLERFAIIEQRHVLVVLEGPVDVEVCA